MTEFVVMVGHRLSMVKRGHDAAKRSGFIVQGVQALVAKDDKPNRRILNRQGYLAIQT